MFHNNTFDPNNIYGTHHAANLAYPMLSTMQAPLPQFQATTLQYPVNRPPSTQAAFLHTNTSTMSLQQLQPLGHVPPTSNYPAANRQRTRIHQPALRSTDSAPQRMLGGQPDLEPDRAQQKHSRCTAEGCNGAGCELFPSYLGSKDEQVHKGHLRAIHKRYADFLAHKAHLAPS